MQDLARRVDGGELPTLDEAHAIADAELIERLVKVRGIGRWSAEMFLMFRLGRPDILPLDDYSLRKAYAKAFRKRALPSPKALEKAGEKWRPYRTVASWYLWRVLDLPVFRRPPPSGAQRVEGLSFASTVPDLASRRSLRTTMDMKPRSCDATGVTRLL